ncbi:MAG TPA: zinc-ribbon domain-containing protein [Candidatus Eisenbergiella stercorigallinarum]|uniref:Zinc-ribbon domain-containing protein n=1 Tax=Candidatus Eisenbergiella stercorigallinarum TaxID=2838557 RepID=A0A9D2QZ27_9FIRM|nr:zinc-ribbon domain-containing protein [Candidatus Eisenbergiella stercorigallinarum]
MYCEHCGAQLEEGAVFCQNCGAKVEPEPNRDEEQTSERPREQTGRQEIPSPVKQATRRKKVGIWKWILLAAAAAAVVLAGFLLLGREKDYISMVQIGYLGEYTDATVQEILETYFGSDDMALEWTGTEMDGVPCVGFHAYPEGGTLNDGTTVLFQICKRKVFKVADMGGKDLEDMEPTEIAYWLNFYYMNWYVTEQAGADSTGEERIPVLQELVQNRLDQVSGTAVLYGASADYKGDRSGLYEAAGDPELIDLSAAELIDSYTNNMLTDSLAEAETDSASDGGEPEAGTGEYPAAEPADTEPSDGKEASVTAETAPESEEDGMTGQDAAAQEAETGNSTEKGIEEDAEEFSIYGSYYADNGVDATLYADVGVYTDDGRDYISLTAMSYGDRYLAEFSGILNEVEENVYRAMDDTGLAVIRVEFEPYGMTVALEQMETEDYYDFRYLEGYYRKTEELNFDEVG